MTKIPVGLASILGTLGLAAGIIIPGLGALADATAPLGIEPAVWLKVGAVLGGLVIVGRMAQAIVAAVRKDGA